MTGGAPDEARAYWESRLKDGPSIETVGWIGLGRRFNQAMYAVRAAVFVCEARAALRAAGLQPATARVLDAGSGSGFYTALWRRLGVRDLTGCDLTDAVVSALSKRMPGVPFERVDIGRDAGAFAAGTFDVVSCMDVVFHITDDSAYEHAIGNLARWLRPGGLLLLSENCLHRERIGGAHQVSRTLAETQAALTSAGLKIIRRRPMFVFMNTPVDSRSRMLRRMWAMTSRVASKAEWMGAAAGALLFVPELAAVTLLREGPSTELLVCRKS